MWASLRTRVTAGAVVVFALMLVIIGLGVVQVVKSTLVSDAQRVAEVQARNLAVAAQVGRLPEVIDADAHGETVLQVVDAEGEVVGFSPTLVGMPALGDPLGNDDDGVATTIRVAHPSGGVDYRVVALPTSSPTGPITVFAGSALTEAETLLTRLVTGIILGFVIVLGVVGVLTWLVVKHSLQPVERMRLEVDDITNTELDRRLALPKTKDEIYRLATTMNRMLDRLQQAALRQNAFIADASHELRSPLASLRTQLEVAATHPETMNAQEVAQDALVDVERLQRLSQDLLTLTRLDATTVGPRQLVDVGEVVGEVVDVISGDGPQVVVHPAPAPALAWAVVSYVERVVTNLIDNARRHAATLVEVDITITTTLNVIVTDDGAGIAVEDHERVFDRFVRLDDPRARTDGGSGLGLAIARDAARAMGGEVGIVDRGQGACFVFSLPLPLKDG